MKFKILRIAMVGVILFASSLVNYASAGEMYWSLFNVEEETSISSAYVTYSNLDDMLNDANRIDTFLPDDTFGGSFAANVVGSGSDGNLFWSLFNVEEETSISSAYVTYSNLDDMLNDANRIDTFLPDDTFGGSFAANVVGSGSDGNLFWSLFNVEEETSISSAYVTYSNLDDMLNDANRIDTFLPDDTFGGSFAANVVGSGSDGNLFWSLFNVEEETSISSAYVTYSNLDDMLNDANRIDTFLPDDTFGGSFAANVVGSGAFMVPDPNPNPIPEPSAFALFLSAIIAVSIVRRKR